MVCEVDVVLVAAGPGAAQPEVEHAALAARHRGHRPRPDRRPHPHHPRQRDRPLVHASAPEIYKIMFTALNIFGHIFLVFSALYIFRTNIFCALNIFWTNNFYGSKYFWSDIILELQVFFRHNIFLTLCESRPSPWRKTPPSCTKSTGTEIRRRVERRGSPSEQSPQTSRTCRETPAAATSRTLTATITTLKNCYNGKHFIFFSPKHRWRRE